MIRITDGELEASFQEYGAELTSLKKGGAEYLWSGDGRYWERQAPVLFPFVGRLYGKKYLYQGREYAMDIHGFACRSRFQVIRMTKTEVCFSLKDSEETRSCYPFRFVFEITYRLRGSVLQVEYRVRNLSEECMYFGIGGHPGFRVPLDSGRAFENYQLVFADPGKPERILFSDGGLVTGREDFSELSADGVLSLRRSLFDHDAVFLAGTGKAVRLCSAQGGRAVEISFPDMSYVGFWQPAGMDAPFLCIEPWASLPGREGTEEELGSFPGLIHLESGKEYCNIWEIKLY